jgi:hypothetical protein
VIYDEGLPSLRSRSDRIEAWSDFEDFGRSTNRLTKLVDAVKHLGRLSVTDLSPSRVKPG